MYKEVFDFSVAYIVKSYYMGAVAEKLCSPNWVKLIKGSSLYLQIWLTDTNLIPERL